MQQAKFGAAIFMAATAAMLGGHLAGNELGEQISSGGALAALAGVALLATADLKKAGTR